MSPTPDELQAMQDETAQAETELDRMTRAYRELRVATMERKIKVMELVDAYRADHVLGMDEHELLRKILKILVAE